MNRLCQLIHCFIWTQWNPGGRFVILFVDGVQSSGPGNHILTTIACSYAYHRWDFVWCRCVRPIYDECEIIFLLFLWCNDNFLSHRISYVLCFVILVDYQRMYRRGICFGTKGVDCVTESDKNIRCFKQLQLKRWFLQERRMGDRLVAKLTVLHMKGNETSSTELSGLISLMLKFASDTSRRR